MGFQSLAKPQLPVIKFSIENNNLHPKSTKWIETCSHVRAALEEYGCFMAEFESAPEGLDDAIFKGLEELFDLPIETKIKNVSDKPYHGFVDQYRAPFVLPLHQSFGIENAATFEAVEFFVNLMWPSGNHRFCENMFSYSKMVSEMEQLVKRMMFESYGVEKYYDSHIASTTYLLRTMKYRIPQMGEDNIGADRHTDQSFFTILHQNGVNGLEIKTKYGDWLGVHFSPNSFLVMAGDACLAWSNGRIHSATHRVIIEGTKERYSPA